MIQKVLSFEQIQDHVMKCFLDYPCPGAVPDKLMHLPGRHWVNRNENKKVFPTKCSLLFLNIASHLHRIRVPLLEDCQDDRQNKTFYAYSLKSHLKFKNENVVRLPLEGGYYSEVGSYYWNALPLVNPNVPHVKQNWKTFSWWKRQPCRNM